MYLLVLFLEKDRRIRVGALGAFDFRAGYYTYAGRALRGLPARVARHFRKKKPLRWHIDYFRKHAEVVEVRAVESREAKAEARLAGALIRKARARMGADAIPAPGFGASDSPLPAHLVYWGKRPPAAIREVFPPEKGSG